MHKLNPDYNNIMYELNNELIKAVLTDHKKSYGKIFLIVLSSLTILGIIIYVAI